jgi:outer membrane protein insertion porin family
MYEKYFLGGEQNIRGFEFYRIGPKNSQGAVIGGSKAFHANVEYQIPLSEQISFNLFYDMGNAYDFGKALSLNDVYSSMGLEIKVYIPMLNVPFRLIFAYNPRLSVENEAHFQFQIGMGPSFY